MATICDRVGVEDIMQGFDFYMQDSTPQKPLYYSVWNGQKLKFISKEADPDAARNEFAQILNVWHRNGTGGMLEARFHRDRPNSQLNSKSDYEGSMTFKLRDESLFPYQQQPAAPAPAQPVNPMGSFLEQYKMFLEMQQLLQPAPSVNGDPERDIWDRIEGLLSTPIVEDVIAGIADKFGLNMKQVNREAAIAGDQEVSDVPAIDQLDDTDEERLRRAISRLLVVDPDFVDTLERLADMAEKKPAKYKMAKGFL